MLNIHLLGKTTIDWDGERLEGQLGGKAVALLYLLLGAPTHFLPRDRLTLYLWPDSAEEAARYNLRYNLWLLKKTLPAWEGETLILTEKDGCRLSDRYPWRCDLTEIKDFDPERGDPAALLQVHRLFRGEIMEGWYLKNCSEFNDLILLDRMVCESKHVKVLQSLARRLREAGEDRRCLEVLLEIAAIEPNNEDAALEILEAYVRLGDRVGAIRYYKRFETALRNELGISPNEALQALYRHIRSDGPAREAPAPAEERAGETVVTGRCMGDIPYFLLADLIAGAVRELEPQALLTVDERYIRDLAPIQTEAALRYERAGGGRIDPQGSGAPDVRVIQAFCKLVEALCAQGRVRLRIRRRDRADPISAAALEYLEELEIENLTVES